MCFHVEEQACYRHWSGDIRNYLQPLGDLLDGVLHDLPGTQTGVPQLVAHLAAKPVGVGCAQGVEVQGGFGVHANAQVVVHGLVLSLRTPWQWRVTQ